MCMCGKTIVNGEPGYSWDGKSFGTREPNPPDLTGADSLLYDLPGRCGGIDSHSYHFRVVQRYGSVKIIVRHGAGEEELTVYLSSPIRKVLKEAGDTERYWIVCTLYHATQAGARKATDEINSRWYTAAAEKRIKTRKLPRQGRIKVWIEPKKQEAHQ